jgi:hypothetical protein
MMAAYSFWAQKLRNTSTASIGPTPTWDSSSSSRTISGTEWSARWRATSWTDASRVAAMAASCAAELAANSAGDIARCQSALTRARAATSIARTHAALAVYDAVSKRSDVPEDVRHYVEALLREAADRKNREFREALGLSPIECAHIPGTSSYPKVLANRSTDSGGRPGGEGAVAPAASTPAPVH